MNTIEQNTAILAEIEDAYCNREIKVYYQPIYDSLTNKLICAEALSRWIKDDGTFIMPGNYIPALEQSDAILDLDWYMLKEVCISMHQQMQLDIPVVKISVNFSRKHIFDKYFAAKLCEVVDSFGIDHKLIQIEITESALTGNTAQTEAFINSIRNEGFGVAIDDFGSGLSSLSMVKDVDVDTLKIDRSLLSKNCEDEKERIVLESIISFAHRLKLTVVAEGVETMEQLAFLRTCGCELIQGFLLGKPMSQDDFRKICKTATKKILTEDILSIQPQSSAIQLLLDAIYTRYPLIIYINLTRDSYYMMAYENFSTTSCVSSGAFDDCIKHAANTMHPDDQLSFIETFSVKNQMEAYNRGEKFISLITRQLGDDGIYRRIETVNYFVKNPSVDDVLVISLNHSID